MTAFKKFWHALSNIGIDESLETHLRRKIALTNQLAFTVAVVVLTAWVSLGLAFHGTATIFGPIIVAPTIYALTILFNALRWHTFSRIWFNLSPLGMLLLSAGMISDGQVVSMKIALLSVVIVPLVLFGIEERGKMIAGIAMVILAYLGMDFVTPLIPNQLAIDMAVIDSPLSIGISGVLSFILFTFAFVYFQDIAQARLYPKLVE